MPAFAGMAFVAPRDRLPILESVNLGIRANSPLKPG
jgi:hypothetical protein